MSVKKKKKIVLSLSLNYIRISFLIENPAKFWTIFIILVNKEIQTNFLMMR